MQAPTIRIERVNTSAAVSLQELSVRTFFDAFGHLNNPADMEAYAAQAFTLQKLLAELANPNSHFYFAFADDTLAGYIKLNYGSALTEMQDASALEVERIYVLRQFQGRQIGKQLLAFAIDTAIKRQLNYLWLGVWEHNTNAIRFYQSNGFIEFGSHQFMLGADEQRDILMRKELV